MSKRSSSGRKAIIRVGGGFKVVTRGEAAALLEDKRRKQEERQRQAAKRKARKKRLQKNAEEAALIARKALRDKTRKIERARQLAGLTPKKNPKVKRTRKRRTPADKNVSYVSGPVTYDTTQDDLDEVPLFEDGDGRPGT